VTASTRIVSWLAAGAARVCRVVYAALLSLLVVTVFAQVLARYVFLAPLVWAEELAVFCFSWVVMLGIALGTRERAHLVCDFLPQGAGRRLDGITETVAGLVVVVAAVVFIVYGSQFAVLGLRRFSFATGLPMTGLYVAMPVSGLLMLLFVGEQVVRSRVGLPSSDSIRVPAPAEIAGPPPQLSP
jgi:TRAP-type C4-dicarboxylate transport system permease small subunit